MSHKASRSKTCAVAASQDTRGGGWSVGVQQEQKRRGLSGPLPLAGVPGSPPSGIRSTTGLSDMFSECDTCWPTEDSKYIFYGPGKLSPVTFRRKEDGRSRGTSHGSVI